MIDFFIWAPGAGLVLDEAWKYYARRRKSYHIAQQLKAAVKGGHLSTLDEAICFFEALEVKGRK